MRTLIISDIHANLTALNAVLADAEPYDRVWCLGDVVGYGPDPNECIERVKSLPGLKCVKGNHDAAIIGDIDINSFNLEARASLQWLESELKPANRRWLSNLGERLEFRDITIVHGSPSNPVWEYIMDRKAAKKNMSEFSTKVCLVGHTHVPQIYEFQADTSGEIRHRQPALDETFQINHKSIINPGSVGQPRDHDPRSSYLIYNSDDESWVYHRVEYDITKVQDRILAAGLPQRHASRLKSGW